MAWCLTKKASNEFKKALVSGEIDPVKLAGMTSKARSDFLAKYVGKENAQKVNSLFESKLLLKNQQRGMVTWAKRTTGITPQTKRDLISRIERMETILSPKDSDPFLQDLASTRLGIDVTQAEAKIINKLSVEMVKSKDKWQAKLDKNPSWSEDPISTRKEWLKDDTRIDYGLKQVELEKYVNDLKLQAKKVSFRERPTLATVEAIKKVPGIMKSAMSSLDDSFYGRQGVKSLLGQPKQKVVWVRNFVKSFGDMARGLKGYEAMDLIKADIYSRPNAINGKYKAGGYRLDVLSEEAFPSSLPERIPGFGRLFRASEVAYSGGALRMRADLADILIAKADKQGINTLDKDEAQGIGNLVGSMTGRGSIGKLEPVGKEINVLLYSIKFLKSNIDTLTAHQFDPKATPFTKKEARKNLASIVITLAGVLGMAKILDPDSVDEDPRSTNFGKIKMFGHWIDITGGMASITRTAARLVPTKHNGEWGLWQKSSTGNWTNLVAGKYGQQDGWDLLIDSFFSNKLAPIASIERDALRGEMFGGEPFNIQKSITNSLTPLSIQTFNDIKDEKTSNVLGTMIFELFGFSPSTYKYKAHWEKSTSEEMKQFKKTVGEEKFKKANDDYNRAYNIWFDEVTKTEEYKELSDDGKGDLIKAARKAIKEKILEENEFEYEEPKKTKEEKEEKKTIDELKKKLSGLNPLKEILKMNPFKVRQAMAAGLVPEFTISDQGAEKRNRDIKWAKELKRKHPEWYAKNVGEKGEVAIFGESITSWKAPDKKAEKPFSGLSQKEPEEKYAKSIVISSDKNKVNPSLVAAVLWQESGYIPDATNENLDENGNVKSIDRGMAQINSAAYPNITEEQAFDPDFSIKFLPKKLKSDLDYFDGDWNKAIAAYNRGRRRVYEDGIDELGQKYIDGVSKNLSKELIEELGLKTSG